jgi:nucleoside-diphosphate-sugar epimerase
MTRIKMGDIDKYLLTGATGFLGSHIMAGLLLKGKRVVIFGRSSDGLPLKERIRKLLMWFGIENLEGLLEIHETDFLMKNLGLGKDEYEHLCRRGLPVIHCASDTSFAEKNRERVMKSNVENLTEILNFVSRSKCRWFHFISTAFAAGTGTTEFHEAPVIPENFTNVYEESKAYAENIIIESCNKNEVPYTIIRPSIVYGDSVNGRSLKFNALYVPVRSTHVIRDIYLEDIRKNNGRKAAECGIHLGIDGVLHLPMKIFIPDKGKINLIPVDYFTKTVLSIIENPIPGTFYHITSNNPENMERLAIYTQRLLNITGIEVIIGTPGSNETRNAPEELFDHLIKPYMPYIADKRIFKRENTDRLTSNAYPPDLSYEIFEKCMAFAISADWGKKLFYSD